MCMRVCVCVYQSYEYNVLRVAAASSCKSVICCVTRTGRKSRKKVTSASLRYPLSVFNKNSTLKESSRAAIHQNFPAHRTFKYQLNCGLMFVLLGT